MIQELKLKIKECIENYVLTTYEKEVTAVVEQPKNMEMGDIAVPVFSVMKTIGKPLPAVVTEIKELLLQKSNLSNENKKLEDKNKKLSAKKQELEDKVKKEKEIYKNTALSFPDFSNPKIKI